MYVKDLDGKISDWKYYHKSNHSKRSLLHLACRELLKKLFPTQKIFEEVRVDIRKGEILFLDFFLPLKMLVVEVHGEQHYKFSLHYHGNRWNFLESKRRDREKLEWCQLNDIRFVELPYNEKIEDWTKRIIG
jgi:uncharacterized UPF0160 family protein